MKAWAASFLALLALASIPVVAAPEAAADPAPPALRLLLPGRLVSAAVGTEGGRQVLAVVLRDDDRRRQLYVYDPEARTLTPRGAGLPEGSPEIAAGGGGGLWLGLARYGGLDLVPLGEAPAEDGPAATSTFTLPRRAERTSWGLRLASPAVHAVADPSAGVAGAPCFATEPEAHGRRRLRVLLLCPGREPEEAWELLPGAETVTAARFAVVDGAPMLAVLTRERLGLFVKQDLRVFPLAGSRSRVGTGPVLEARTDCPLWRGSELSFTDADGDGADDLVVVCRTGLVDEELRVEIYRHRRPDEGGAAFDRRPRTAKLDGDFGSWHYGEDWTGDGVPDLLAVRDGLLEVHAGDVRGRPVAPRPSRTLALPGGDEDGDDESRVEVEPGTDGGDVHEWRGGARLVAAADLDGDGRPELVVHRAREDGGELLVLTP